MEERMNRRNFIEMGALSAGGALLLHDAARAQEQRRNARSARGQKPSSTHLVSRGPVQRTYPGGQPAVTTPNGTTLSWRTVRGIKVGHLIVEPLQHEFAPGLEAQCWGYN